MRSFLRAGALALVMITGVSLGGCATVDKIKAAYETVTSATVTTQQVKIAIDSFDVLQVAATDLYLPLHPCSATRGFPCRGAAKPVVDALRAGRAARNNLKAMLRASVASSSGTIAAADYNALTVASATIKAALTSYGINF